jgi:hypothetical protein
MKIRRLVCRSGIIAVFLPLLATLPSRAQMVINMLFIPSMTQAIFGGAAGITSNAATTVGGTALLLLKGGGG